MKILFTRKYWICWFLFLSHITIVIYIMANIVLMCNTQGMNSAQWELDWEVLRYIDFPVSLLLFPFLDLVPSVSFDYFCIMPEPMTDVMFYGPALFFLLIGSTWFFILPILIQWCYRKINDTFLGKWLISLLILLPVGSSWIEFILHNHSQIDLYAQIVFSAIWICSFISLFLISRKKSWTGLLLLMFPFVIWHLIGFLLFYAKIYPRIN